MYKFTDSNANGYKRSLGRLRRIFRAITDDDGEPSLSMARTLNPPEESRSQLLLNFPDQSEFIHHDTFTESDI